MGDNKISNPQRLLFKEYYCHPESETFGNALGSAVRAGYSESYANSITGQSNEWFSEIIRDHEMIHLAEKVLHESMAADTRGDSALTKIKQDSAKFVASRLGKKKWSDRTEVTGAEGKDLTVQVVNYAKPKPKPEEDEK